MSSGAASEVSIARRHARPSRRAASADIVSGCMLKHDMQGGLSRLAARQREGQAARRAPGVQSGAPPTPPCQRMSGRPSWPVPGSPVRKRVRRSDRWRRRSGISSRTKRRKSALRSASVQSNHAISLSWQ